MTNEVKEYNDSDDGNNCKKATKITSKITGESI
jgi:hypothetical protein